MSTESENTQTCEIDKWVKYWVPCDFVSPAPKYGYVPNYPPPLEGNENKLY
jgi:hypothetical protein